MADERPIDSQIEPFVKDEVISKLRERLKLDVEKVSDEALFTAFLTLNERYRNILLAWYTEYKTARDIAEEQPEKVTKERIHQIIKKAESSINNYVSDPFHQLLYIELKLPGRIASLIIKSSIKSVEELVTFITTERSYDSRILQFSDESYAITRRALVEHGYLKEEEQ